MRLAIDVGNTHTVFGFGEIGDWKHVFRFKTDTEQTEDELAALVLSAAQAQGVDIRAAKSVGIASVVPAVNQTLEYFCSKWLGIKPDFLTAQADYGIAIRYEPRTAVGADRIANALAGLRYAAPPFVVVDFGTATTFDAIDKNGAYVGGAIMPGPLVSASALVGRTAKLPQTALEAPSNAIGRSTVESLQSGLVLGYADAIDGLAGRISNELGGAKVIATGGLAPLFMGVCKRLDQFYPNLVLDGILIAQEKAKS